MKLFHAMEQALGKKEVIAEDLGYVTESVKKLVSDSGFPGMKLLEFAFDSREITVRILGPRTRSAIREPMTIRF